MTRALRYIAKIRKNRCAVGWIANLLLAIFACWRVDWRVLSFFQPSYSSFQRLNWYILDTLSRDSQLLYDGWSSGSAKERLLPGMGPATVHYFSCDDKPFDYNNYLSILSVYKTSKPDKIILHMTGVPGSANPSVSTLLDELLYTIPIISIQSLPKDHLCTESTDAFMTLVLSTVLTQGGVYCDWNTIFTEFSPLLLNSTLLNNLSFKTGPDKILRIEGGTLISRGNTGIHIDKFNYRSILNRAESDDQCTTPAEYNLMPNKYLCVLLDEPIEFENVRFGEGHFPELIRWLVTGKKEVLPPLRSDTEKIPLLAHIVRRKQGQLKLIEYHSVLSAVKVGFLVKFYSFSKPSGPYWNRIRETGKVQFIFINKYDFGNKTSELHRAGDILCVDLVLREGGVCQTTHTLWRNALPNSLRFYDFVMGQQNGRPDITVLMGKRHARFLKVLIPRLRLYDGNNWNEKTTNTVYRTLQMFPDLVYTKSELSATCEDRQCVEKLHRNTPKRVELYINILPTAEKWLKGSALAMYRTL